MKALILVSFIFMHFSTAQASACPSDNALGLSENGLVPAEVQHGESRSSVPAILEFTISRLRATLTWESGPRVSAESVLKIVWTQIENDNTVEVPGPFEVQLWMPSMGHGSAPTRNEILRDEQGRPVLGTYRVSNIYFVMGGDWEVNITLLGQDGKKDTKTLELNLPARGGHH